VPEASRLVLEVPLAGEDHDYVAFIGSGNRFVLTY
jgi:hypothetical protein